MRLFTFSLLLGIFASCVTEETLLEEPIEFNTDTNIEFFHVTQESDNKINEHGVHYLLGHGYDVTGNYASNSSGRKQIFDLSKIAEDWPSAVSSSPVHLVTVGNDFIADGSTLLKSLSGNFNDLNGTASFRETLDVLFPNQDHTKKYVYGINKYYKPLESHKLMAMPEKKYYVDEFKNAIHNQSVEDIVKSYGTHLISIIILGAEVQSTYRTETDNTDHTEAALNGLNIAMENIFRSNYDFVDYKTVKGNFNQQLSFYVKGGDKSKIKITPKNEYEMVMVNYHEWFNSISKENMEIINMVIFPLYQYIEDQTKQKELKDYTEKYIKDNQLDF